MKTALVVEDDPALAQTLKTTLQKLGLNSVIESKLSSAWDRVEQQAFTLAVLDRVLPDGDGLELIAPLLDKQVQTRILVLSQQAQTSHKISGLRQGADDYLAKPFNLRELKLRLQKLLAKNKIMQPELLTYKNLCLDPETGSATIEHHQVRFRPKQAKLLACLIQHRGLIVTPRTMLAYVWGDQLNQPNYKSLAVYIRRLRIKLGQTGPRIETIREVGYRLV